MPVPLHAEHFGASAEGGFGHFTPVPLQDAHLIFPEPPHSVQPIAALVHLQLGVNTGDGINLFESSMQR